VQDAIFQSRAGKAYEDKLQILLRDEWRKSTLQRIKEKTPGHGSAIPRGDELNPPQKTAKRLYSITDAADYLGLSTWTIREMVWKGKLPYIRFGRRKLVDVQDLDALILRNKIDEP